MPTKDLSQLKEKIINFLEENGPSLPAQIARHIETDMIFASAFLSELYSEKKLKLTNMRVGSSPVYFLKEQKDKLEKYGSEYLKSKEKEAFERLKEKRVLNEEEQEPAIRVALKEIKDFAIPFQSEGKNYWRYFLEEDYYERIKPKEKKNQEEEEKNLEEEDNSSKEEKQVIEKKEEQKKEKAVKKKKTTKKKTLSPKKDEKFFNSVKEFLKSKNKEIEDIINFNKNELILKINENGEEKIIVAFSKKRVTENDISKIYKKISEFGLRYDLLSLGEPAKKTENLIEALKNLDKIDKLE